MKIYVLDLGNKLLILHFWIVTNIKEISFQSWSNHVFVDAKITFSINMFLKKNYYSKTE